jgi:hypothetical protein
MSELHKGIGFIPGTDAADIARLNGSWYYNWWHTPEINAGDTTFLPMIWSHRQVEDAVLETIRHQTPPAVLTWNEPSLKTQAALPPLNNDENVELVMGYWQRIYVVFKPLGIPIVSPAPASKPGDQRWARRFLREVKRRNMLPDIVAVHHYCAAECGRKRAPDELMALLTGWRKWLDKTLKHPVPIWLTEYGCYDVCKDDTREYMKNSFDILLRRDTYDSLGVERYCWFANRTFHPVFANAALFDRSGALTEIGEIYRSIPAVQRG